MRTVPSAVLGISLLTIVSFGSIAQGLPAVPDLLGRSAPQESVDPHKPEAPWSAGRDNPRSAVYGYIVAARTGNYEEAATYLDLSNIPEAERAKRGVLLARELKVVLDQKLWIDFESISDHPGGAPDDGLPEGRDRIGTIPTRQGNMDIIVRRTGEAETGLQWRFSKGTVERISILNAEYGYGRLGRWLPDWSTRMRFWNLETWQWLGLGVLLASGLLLAYGVTWLLYLVFCLFTPRSDPGFRDPILATIRRPIWLFVTIVVTAIEIPLLHLSIPARQVFGRIGVALGTLFVAWALAKLADQFTEHLIERLVREGRRGSVATVVLLRRVAKGAIIALAAMALLGNLGYDVTAVTTGLGIGGLAVALAAQKTLENLFGGVVLTVDQPFRIGDQCRFGDKQGVVEEIGLRSTRVRTQDRTVITVPNAQMSTVQIENFALRDRIPILATLALRYETTPAQLRSVLEHLRSMLLADARIERGTMHARFVGFGTYSLNVEVQAYVLTVDSNEFLAVREDIFLNMMDAVAKSDTGFAFLARPIPGTS